MGRDLAAGPIADDAASLKQDCPIAKLSDRLHLMRNEDNRATRGAQVLHAPQAALLELGIANREHLVDEEDLGLEMSSYRKRQPHRHSTRIALHGRVDELLDTRELDDLRVLALNLLTPHAEHRAVQVDVLAACELGMKAGPDFQQASDTTADLGATARGGGDAREDPQQRRLAGAVPSDDAQHLALGHLERDIAESPDLLEVRTMLPVDDPTSGRGERFAEGAVGAVELA